MFVRGKEGKKRGKSQTSEKIFWQISEVFNHNQIFASPILELEAWPPPTAGNIFLSSGKLILSPITGRILYREERS